MARYRAFTSKGRVLNYTPVEPTIENPNIRPVDDAKGYFNVRLGEGEFLTSMWLEINIRDEGASNETG